MEKAHRGRTRRAGEIAVPDSAERNGKKAVEVIPKTNKNSYERIKENASPLKASSCILSRFFTHHIEIFLNCPLKYYFMARSQRRSLRKPSGGRYHFSRTKKLYELAGYPVNTALGDAKRRSVRTQGGNLKQRILQANIINVSQGKGAAAKTEILNVVENPANPNLVRRNIITKGCVVETKLGKVRVTSRPGQQGSLSGVLV